MKTRLILRPRRLTDNRNADLVARAVSKSTAELESDIKTGILQSRPAGKTYRLNPIVRRQSNRTRNLDLKRRGQSLIVGYNFHRASAKGQPPAILSGRLINSIRGRKVTEYRGRVGVSVIYAKRLDDPQGLDRPFFMSRAEAYRHRFFENVRIAYFGR